MTLIAAPMIFSIMSTTISYAAMVPNGNGTTATDDIDPPPPPK